MKVHFVSKFTHPGENVSFYRNGSFLTSAAGRTCLRRAA